MIGNFMKQQHPILYKSNYGGIIKFHKFTQIIRVGEHRHDLDFLAYRRQIAVQDDISGH
ncbi:hypothetical protein SDC9_203627 [bioreactor metagenome]|uniref:Uncharacterized protein n=1 Tax=bioreactor metagenome TaxID=1076179 RepID=A0A645J8V9_9ZZZZ